MNVKFNLAPASDEEKTAINDNFVKEMNLLKAQSQSLYSGMIVSAKMAGGALLAWGGSFVACDILAETLPDLKLQPFLQYTLNTVCLTAMGSALVRGATQLFSRQKKKTQIKEIAEWMSKPTYTVGQENPADGGIVLHKKKPPFKKSFLKLNQ